MNNGYFLGGLLPLGPSTRRPRQDQGDRKHKNVSQNMMVIDVTLSLSKGLAAATGYSPDIYKKIWPIIHVSLCLLQCGNINLGHLHHRSHGPFRFVRIFIAQEPAQR